MPSEELSKPIANGLFRERRVYLSDDAFAFGDDDTDVAPTDLIDRGVWEHLTDLPTDVLLRTTDHFGRRLGIMGRLAHAWICALEPLPEKAPYAYGSWLDAYDEFEVAPFIAAHGWYRHATSCLRSALEVMTCAARYAVRSDVTGCAGWREGTSPGPKFGNALEIIANTAGVRAVESTLPHPGLFGRKPDGVVQALYARLCRFAHGSAGHTSTDLWGGSNGPIFVGSSFIDFWRDYRDTYLACWVLLRLACPVARAPGDIAEIARAAGTVWLGTAPAAVAAYCS